MSKKNLIDGITGVLVEKGFNITTANAEVGLLQASTNPEYSVWTGANSSYHWMIKINKNNVVTAQAKIATFTQNAFGATTASSETYLGDDTHEDLDWYWDVRNMIQELCDSEISIIKTEK